ncbi:MAG: ThiF family adenylyltransferase [Patescibacteria group bacterium]
MEPELNLKPTPKRASKPVFFDLSESSNRTALQELFAAGDIIHVIDEYESQLKELFTISNPSLAQSSELPASFSTYFQSLSKVKPPSEQGTWVYFPWLSMISHILSDAEFQKVRTARNKNLITEEEQKKLYATRVAIAGLSVGNSVALAIVLQGGARRIKLADHDTLELSNLNRIRAGVESLGLTKVEITARQIYLLDPYAEVELFLEGITEENIELFFNDVDIVIDEIDSLPMKYRIREEAKKRNLPVLMAADNADSGIIDIERYDLDPSTTFFNGRIRETRQEILHLDKKETGALIADFVGLENHSEKMLGSLSALIGSTLVSWPQLGSTALMNGSALAYVVRQIARGVPLPSGRTKIPLDNLFHIGEGDADSPTALEKAPDATWGDELDFILEAGRFAPSADNTQPWRVVITDNKTFYLHHVPQRDMTPYDNGQRTSYMSHGAFIENVRIAAAKLGKSIQYALEEPTALNDYCVARLTIQDKKDALNARDAELYGAVFSRATNRKTYRKEPLSDITNQRIMLAQKEIGWGEVRIIDCPNREIARAAALSGQIMFQNPDVHEGLFAHIRWTPKEARDTQDGFLIDTFELPFPAKLIFKLAQSAERLEFLNRSIKLAETIPTGMQDLYEHSGSYIALVSEHKTFEDYVMLGRLMERIWLTATLEGVALQPIGAMCFFKDMLDAKTTQALSKEDILLTEKAHAVFEKEFDLKGKHLLFLFRAGYGPKPSARTERLSLSRIVKISGIEE